MSVSGATRLACAAIAACAALLVALTMADAAAAGPLRLPSWYVEVDPASESNPEADGEQANRTGPLRARPAPAAGVDQPRGPDPALAPATAVIGPVPGPSRSFEGISNSLQSPLFGQLKLPADTTGDVGPNHYVQAVNTSFMVFAKDGTPLLGPVAFAGTGGLFDSVPGIDHCDLYNRGDPVVLYDESADRWVIGQFAFTVDGSNVPEPPYKQCVAVSRTGDPMGDWWLYEFELSNSSAQFPDYPKLGVWHDAYYLSANAFDLAGPTAVGGLAVALERSKMLDGLPARMVTDASTRNDRRYFGLLPADIDGASPPAGAPGLFLALEDDNYDSANTDGLRLWTATVDWTTPSLTLAESAFMPVAPFDSALCGGARNCIPQPNATVGLDPLSGQLLHRLAYRNFGSRQALVTTHVADANSPTNHAGMRWYELQNTGSGWSVVQTSTFAPDADHRWMGSIALDASGNIGLGYSTSSATTFPSINYSGRFATDAPSVLTQGEGTLIAGGGSQNSTTSRWGDYSTLSVDPTDGCTFWYTNLYYPVQANALWHTRIGSFSLLTDPVLSGRGHMPGVWSSSRFVQVALSGAKASCSIGGYSTAWSNDPAVQADGVADVGATSTSVSSSKLAEGEHYLRVRTVDAQGNVADGSTIGPFLIDATRPKKLVIDPSKPRPFQTARRFPVAWSGIDALSGIATFDVRYRRAPTTGGFGARKSFRAKTPKSKGSFVGKAGSTYCFSARADDVAGNGSGYGRERCTAVPLDDRDLSGKRGWRRLRKSKAYRRTTLLTTRQGATLFARNVRARSLALMATRCGRCGAVEVRHRGRLVGVVDLTKKPYGAGLVNELPGTKRVRKGKVTLTVVSSGRRVAVDGLGASRVRVTA